MNRKTILITGPASGIGRFVALELARQGMRLVLVCRDQEKGEQLLSELHGKDHILIITDLSQLHEIDNCIKYLFINNIKLDVLINNAGVFFTERQLTAAGTEMQFAVNYLAPFALTNGILNRNLMNSEGRIINVSSISHYFGRIRFEDLTLSKRYDGLRAYEQSKLAVVLFTYELARRLRTLPVTVNVLSPGRVNTTIGDKNASGIYRKLWLLNKPILLPVSKGAATYLYLAMDKRAGQFTGKYFYRCRPVWSSLSSYNHKLALKLWQFSESLTEKILQSNTKHENLCT